MRIAVVFPAANRRAGVERVGWELVNFLGERHETIFVGAHMEESEANRADFHQVVPVPFLPRIVGFRIAASKDLARLRPDIVLSLGIDCPPGDVLWVQSVHRAFLDRGLGPTFRGHSISPRIRKVMPRHRLKLSLEERYFASSRPREILCTSEQEISDLNRYYGVGPERCRVIPNGFEPATFNSDRRLATHESSRARLGIGEDEISILFVANELHRKGFGTLLEAFARAALGGARIDVVGRVSSGDYRGRIEHLRLSRAVHWHGSSKDVFPYFAAADLLVLPTQYEPFGLVIIEALACGLPVITSQLAGAASAVSAGKAGRLLKNPVDIDELAMYMREAADPEVRDRWSRGAPQAAAPYAWPNIFQAVEETLAGAPSP